MHRILVFLALGVLVAASPSMAAGLQWERESIEATAQPGQKVVHVEFPFRNAGDRMVTILSVETSCRCTSADTSKKIYAPGEKDAVSVDFAVGGWTGVVDKDVTVTTDGPELKPVVLSLRVTILPPAPAKPAS
jgi:Protein of unknown function (DUF1573)